ncbi:hypothetical protein TNCV_67801 [Trichonephila clavipes]|nr:hypothetical protein TNCV_67801 [Trichonephila clavipes]
MHSVARGTPLGGRLLWSLEAALFRKLRAAPGVMFVKTPMHRFQTREYTSEDYFSQKLGFNKNRTEGYHSEGTVDYNSDGRA